MNAEGSASTSNRNIKLDIARTIGTLLIILAHVGAPKELNEIRCFDVVLLVFVSGYCIHIRQYGVYLYKRFRRLIIPAWVLLICLFFCTWIACILFHKEQLFSASKITKSFLFLNGGIGFIWIVRVYFGIALLSPIIIWINKIIKSNILLIFFAIILIILNSLIAKKYATDNESITYYISEIVAYCIVALLGYRCRETKVTREKNINYEVMLLCITFVGYIFLLLQTGFYPNESKYPPIAPYLFYGIFVTSLLFVLLMLYRGKENTIYEKTICRFSQLSYNTYLIHIFVLSIVDLIEELIKCSINWGIKYITVIIMSSVGAIILDKVIKEIKQRFMRA